MGWFISRVCVAVLMRIARFWVSFWMNRALNQVSDMWNTMNFVMCSLSAVRIILLKAENGGGIIERETPLYLTAMNWVYAKRDKVFFKDSLFRHRADSSYWEHVIQKILANQYIVILTDALPDCFLKNLYIAEGIKMSIVFAVEVYPKGRPTKILYVALNYDDVVDFQDAVFQAELITSITKIRNVAAGLL